MKNQTCPSRALSPGGFTLIELVAVMAIALILATLTFGAYQNFCTKGKMTREIAAGKNLINAYQTYAAENDGNYLPGMDMTVTTLTLPSGKKLSPAHVCQRYPYRLAPYFDYQMKGVVLVNDNEKQIKETLGSMYEYGVSAFPTFGINYRFVGGYVSGSASGPAVQYPDECLSRSVQAVRPLLVFASGGTQDGGIKLDGYNILTPPRFTGQNWNGADWSKDSDPGAYGNVDARYDGKAVCVYSDGSVKLQTIADLRDMRVWSRRAAENDDAGYTVTQ